MGDLRAFPGGIIRVLGGPFSAPVRRADLITGLNHTNPSDRAAVSLSRRTDPLHRTGVKPCCGSCWTLFSYSVAAAQSAITDGAGTCSKRRATPVMAIEAADDLNVFGSFAVFRIPLQFPLSLMIEFLISALRLSGLLPKFIGAANNLHSGWLFHAH